MLFLNNDDVKQVLSMDITLEALEESYLNMIKGQAVCRPRIDMQIPTEDPKKIYQWGTMEGGSRNGYFAIRMKSDILFEKEYAGTRTLEKYCVRPGIFCGLIFLFRVKNGEPLSLMNDGFLQHMRVGADSAIGVKYMANESAQTVGMLGSGGMARSHMESFRLVRNIKKLKVFSPTKKNRETFAREMEAKYEIETIPLDNPGDVYKDVDILAGCTDSNVPVIHGDLLEKGTHVCCIGGRPDEKTFRRIDRFLRLGNATVALNQSQGYDYFTYVTPEIKTIKRAHKYPSGVVSLVQEDKILYLKDVLEGKKARLSPDDITYSERGNLQGAQFHAVAGKVYERAREMKIGREIPSEWLLQDIRD